jgi:hypothetical protein
MEIEPDMSKMRELAAELGYWPATTDDEDIERHRRLNAALDKAHTAEEITRRYTHLRQEGTDDGKSGV